jgi:CDP-4-dehydro-6-deoxyglucose reductase
MPKIFVMPDNLGFEVNSETNILQQALDKNYNVPYACKQGICGACKCKVLAGEVRLEDFNSKILTDEERHQGYTLLCKSYAISDVELLIPDILNKQNIIMTPVKVIELNKYKSVAVIRLKLPPTQNFTFKAGQYINVILTDKIRSYSIASSPYTNYELELHIKYYKAGVFSEYIWTQIQINNILRIKGPLGIFSIKDGNAPLIFVATGTGFAPIKSILEYLIYHKSTREIHFYWGNRFVDDFYLLEYLESIKNKLNITIHLCLSQQDLDGYYLGYVTHKLKQDFDNIRQYELYACGNIKMIEDVYELATNELQLNKNHFYSDVFTPSIS